MDIIDVCKTYLKNYKGLEEYLVEINGEMVFEWNYEDGCLLLGAARMHRVLGDDYFKEYIVKFVSPYIDQQGNIKSYIKGEYNLDFINAGKLFYYLYDETGEDKYRLASETLMEQLRNQPRLKIGNFWHKLIYPFQVWLDGLYMAQPFYMEYENRFNGRRNYRDILAQFNTVREYLYDQKSGLYHHAYDEYKERKWADQETGLSPNFWLRSIGWYLMALIDTYELATEELYEYKARLGELLREALQGVLQYQDPASKLFYQLIALPEMAGNYLETSGSLMVSYAILKGCRLGALLSEKYLAAGMDIFEEITKQKLYEKDGMVHLRDTCAVAGLGPRHERDGSAAYYLSEPVVDDDPKGMGVFMMTYCEYIQAEGVHE